MLLLLLLLLLLRALTGFLLDVVGDPVRQYLRGRKDTIRCIVSRLTDDPAEGGESLLEELEAADTTTGGGGGYGGGAGGVVMMWGTEADGDENAIKFLEQLATGAHCTSQHLGVLRCAVARIFDVFQVLCTRYHFCKLSS